MIFHKLYLPTILILIILPTYLTLSPSWGIYRWVESDKLLFEPITQKQIILTHPTYPYLSVQIKTNSIIKQQFNSYNLSVYSVKGKTFGQIHIISKNKWMEIQVKNVENFNIQINCIIKQDQKCKANAQYIRQQLKKAQNILKNCKQLQNKLTCSTPQTAIIIPINLPNSHKQPTIKNNQLLQLHLQSTKSFMTNFNITLSPQKLQIISYSLSQLINSICLYKYEQSFYFGFCELNRNKKWNYNIKLAAFSIYLLADYHYQLAHMVYKDYFIIVQNKLLYPLNIVSDVLPMPEHVEVFTRFGNVLDLQNQAQLLNSLFVVPMLNQLGTLHEQLNYRQAKQLHPLLLKMLQLKWSSNSPRSSLKSIYQQSFTQDYKFHNYGQQLQMSTAKCAYIYKIIDTFTGILIKHHAYYMPVQHIKQHLQQHFTLLNIMKVYINDDPNAKIGKYKDVISVESNMKLYAKYNGYQSILPYIYGLGKVYPQVTIKQLQTPYGLKSSTQQQQQQHQRKYRYRGDIHSYFNIKIITGLIYRLGQDKTIPQSKKQQLLTQLTKIATSIGNKVLKDYKQNKQIYTSWSMQGGKGKQKNQWGKIFTALFLKWV